MAQGLRLVNNQVAEKLPGCLERWSARGLGVDFFV
jgi:hypothetical protein